jgi:peptidoglycan hydrolase-like amidase
MGKQFWRDGLYSLLIIFLFFRATPSKAAPLAIPPYPSTVNVTMYGLQPDGTRKAFTCNSGNKNFGCTAFCTDYNSEVCNLYRAQGYPYPTSTISAPIESYYLLDVISQEMNPWIYSEQVAVEAQAIAARSYLGWHINNTPGSFDNSNSYQVFIPFKFDSLNPSAYPL